MSDELDASARGRRRGCWAGTRRRTASCCSRSSTSRGRSSAPRPRRSSCSTRRRTSSSSRRSRARAKGRSSARGSRRARASPGSRSSRASRSSSTTSNADPRFSRDRAAETGYVPTSIVASPLLHDERALGVLSVLDRAPGRPFGLAELELLSRFSTQAAIGLDLLLRARRARSALGTTRGQRGARRARRRAARRRRRRRGPAPARGARDAPRARRATGAGHQRCRPRSPPQPLRRDVRRLRRSQPTSTLPSSIRPTSTLPSSIRPTSTLSSSSRADVQAVALEVLVLDLLGLARHRPFSRSSDIVGSPFDGCPGMASHPTRRAGQMKSSRISGVVCNIDERRRPVEPAERAASLAALGEVLSSPPLRRLQLAWVGSILGGWAYLVALGVYAYDQGGAAAVGIVGLIRLIPAALAAPFTSSLVDRFSRVAVMVTSDLARFALMLVAAGDDRRGRPVGGRLRDSSPSRRSPAPCSVRPSRRCSRGSCARRPS